MLEVHVSAGGHLLLSNAHGKGKQPASFRKSLAEDNPGSSTRLPGLGTNVLQWAKHRARRTDANAKRLVFLYVLNHLLLMLLVGKIETVLQIPRRSYLVTLVTQIGTSSGHAEQLTQNRRFHLKGVRA
jgi:hypothetical protein